MMNELEKFRAANSIKEIAQKEGISIREAKQVYGAIHLAVEMQWYYNRIMNLHCCSGCDRKNELLSESGYRARNAVMKFIKLMETEIT